MQKKMTTTKQKMKMMMMMTTRSCYFSSVCSSRDLTAAVATATMGVAKKMKRRRNMIRAFGTTTTTTTATMTKSKISMMMSPVTTTIRRTTTTTTNANTSSSSYNQLSSFSSTNPRPPPAAAVQSLSSQASNSTTTTKRKTRTRRKVAIAMSGGVDSAVVAYLLQQQQQDEDELELLAVHMSNWDYHEEGSASASSSTSSTSTATGFCWEQDWKDARSVATSLEIPIQHLSFQSEYWNDVFEPYIHKISQSITPSPDIDCNRYIKFGVLKQYIKQRYDDVDYCLATGHYARVWDSNSNCKSSSIDTYGGDGSSRTTTTTTTMPAYLQEALEDNELISSGIVDYLLNNNNRSIILMSARDRTKDQSYFLCGVPIQSFANVMFPLGDLYKNDQNQCIDSYNSNTITTSMSDEYPNRSVRQIAKDANLPSNVANKRDSVGICFVGKRKHGEFINEYVTPPPSLSSASSTSSTTRSSSSSASSTTMTDQNELFELINIEDGTVVGTFDPIKNPSLLYATAGQGAKISGAAQRWFVVESRHPSKPNQLLVCPGTHHPALYSDCLYIKSNEMNWLAVVGDDGNDSGSGSGSTQNPPNPRPPPLPLRLKCRIRHLQPLVDCEIQKISSSEYGVSGEDDDDDRYVVQLDVPLRGIAPGQVCAFYIGGRDGDLICLGGGPIHERGPTFWERQQDLPSTLHPAGHNDRS